MKANSTRPARQRLSPAQDRAGEGVGKAPTARAVRALPQIGRSLRSWADSRDHGFATHRAGANLEMMDFASLYPSYASFTQNERRFPRKRLSHASSRVRCE